MGQQPGRPMRPDIAANSTGHEKAPEGIPNPQGHPTQTSRDFLVHGLSDSLD